MEEAKEVPIARSGKGWMICSIITIVLLIGVSIFAGILFFSKNDSEIADLNQKIEEKDVKIAELEKEDKDNDDDDDVTSCDTPVKEDTTSTSEKTKSDSVNIDYAKLREDVKKIGQKFDDEIMIYTSERGKYIVAEGSASEIGSEFGGGVLTMYKEKKEGASWKKLVSAQGMIPCSELTTLQKEIFDSVNKACGTD